ncbi:MAG: hypothetical protein LBF38_11700 [Deltaproteobacteria bacterium]|jgi:hypothetical protein|nr:hypothetical protein [Deltaproteobacteria bacterium]
MTKGIKKTPAQKESVMGIEERMDCFGTYDPGDPICHRRCSLVLSCALARNEYLDGQVLEGDPRPKSTLRPHCRK